jgi:DNA-binding PadR family transcriptional regulator
MANTGGIPVYLPLTEATFFILLSMSPSPKHGYAIAKDVQDLSNSRVILSTSTLYTALKRLLEAGWIERAGEDPEPDETGRPRKVYTLTGLGRGILEAETRRLQSLVMAAQLRSVGGQI